MITALIEARQAHNDNLQRLDDARKTKCATVPQLERLCEESWMQVERAYQRLHDRLAEPCEPDAVPLMMEQARRTMNG